MSATKGIRKMSETSMQIEFQFLDQRCRERIKISEQEDGFLIAKSLRDRIIKEITDGTFDYTSTFPNSRFGYRITGEKPPKDFRKTFASCAACGKLYEQTGRQIQRCKKGNVYCSRDCISRAKAGLGLQHLPEWADILLAECKKRAGRKEMEFSLNEEHFRAILFRSGWRCELSGVEFQFEESTQRGPHRPFSPSLDRIDSRAGYTPDNVRLVCLAVNIAMNTWGDSVLLAIAKGIIEREKTKNSAAFRRHCTQTSVNATITVGSNPALSASRNRLSV